MKNQDALNEFKKMWIWLYSHPAHDRRYYMNHVVKIEEAWEKECPICHHAEGECNQCKALWDEGRGNLCEDQQSPLNRWKNTHLSDPNYRMWYAGKIADIAARAMAK